MGLLVSWEFVTNGKSRLKQLTKNDNDGWKNVLADPNDIIGY